MCTLQAQLWCTSSRAKKVIVSMTLLAATVAVLNKTILALFTINITNLIRIAIFKVMVPVAVLVINVVVVIQVHRAAIHAAANLGVQPHHQSTSAVPTVMLITTSLVYVLLWPAPNIFSEIYRQMYSADPAFSAESLKFVYNCQVISHALSRLIYAYNFYVYLITGKQFRSDLYKLFCRCLPSCTCSSSSPSPAPPPPVAAAIVAADAEIARPVEADTAV